jgi:signal transduction histidine kinase
VAAALDGLAERTRAVAGLDVRLSVDLDEDRLDDDVASTVYRLVQESLTNVAKHAAATTVDVTVTTAADAVTVEVRDDGVGFNTGAAGGGFGLVGMRERVELASGSLRVVSAPERGTVVRAHIPLEPGALARADDPAA